MDELSVAELSVHLEVDFDFEVDWDRLSVPRSRLESVLHRFDRSLVELIAQPAVYLYVMRLAVRIHVHRHDYIARKRGLAG